MLSHKNSIGSRIVLALLVRDMAETLAFYRRLGFLVTGAHPCDESPTWSEVQRDGITLQFHTEPPCGSPHQSPVCSGTFYFYPDDVESLAAEWRELVEFEWGPEVMEYGMREFGIQDPNGYYLAFTEPA